MTLPALTMNRTFVRDFAHAQTPCFAMGLVRMAGLRTGFLVMRPGATIPSHVRRDGFRFSHGLVGGPEQAALYRFVFDFFGFGRYLALVNPALPMVRRILETMLERGDCVFFCLNPNRSVTAFRWQLAERDLATIRGAIPAMRQAKTTGEKYEEELLALRRKPDPPGLVMNWTCRDNPDYLDLDENTVSLPPSRQRPTAWPT